MRPSHRLLVLSLTALLSVCLPASAQEIRTQRVGDVTYFHLRLPVPANADTTPIQVSRDPTEGQIRALGRLPRLVPQDHTTRSVYLLFDLPEQRPGSIRFASDGTFQFVGRLALPTRVEQSRFLLLYPSRPESNSTPTDSSLLLPASLVRPPDWIETPLTIDWKTAREAVAGDDLRQSWATGETAAFTVLDAQSDEPGFFTFAREATARTYGVSVPVLARHAEVAPSVYQQVYATTTGAAAIARALQRRRLTEPQSRDRGPRTVPLADVPGIKLPAPDWEATVCPDNARADTLARLVPHDNLYLRFKDLPRLLDFLQLVSEATDFTFQGDDARRLVVRYEQQLGFSHDGVAKSLGAFVINKIAITTSDMYLREGSDVSVIFVLNNPRLFEFGTDLFLAALHKDYFGRIKDTTTKYRGVTIRSLTTPLREVSTHRAMFGDYAILSNSLPALQRILDTHQGKHPALADAPDFRALRCRCAPDDLQEDAFLFLSRAFLERLVSPGTAVKERRRLEAFASLYLVTHAALYHAWQTGSLPANQRALLACCGVKPEEIDTPEGKGVTWNAREKMAVSDVYNTINFVTPLIELPAVERLTAAEEREYERFRKDYLERLPGYANPLAARIGLGKSRLHVEATMATAGRNGLYGDLRQRSGGGTTRLDPSAIPPTALVQWLTHVSPAARHWYTSRNSLGDWALLRLEDDARLRELADFWVRQQLDPAVPADHLPAWARLLQRQSVAVGIGVADRRDFDHDLRSVAEMFYLFAGPFALEPQRSERGVTPVRVWFDPASRVARMVNEARLPGEKAVVPTAYYAHAGAGWYAAFRESVLRTQTERVLAKREENAAAEKETIPISDSIYLSPGAAVRGREAIRFAVEWETNRRAIHNCAAWYPLFRCGLAAGTMSTAERQAAAAHYLGYVPVSADRAAFVYDPVRDEVVNRRHGSLRRPELQTSGIEEVSPLGRLLARFARLRVDLRLDDKYICSVLESEREGLAAPAP
jgi:hypothetical protein